MTERSGVKNNLSAGLHDIRVEYRNGGGAFGLEVRYQGPDINKRLIPNSALGEEEVNATTPALSGQVPTKATGGTARKAMEDSVLSEEGEITTEVYPNPFTNKLSVKLSTPVNGVTVQLVNAMGVVVYSEMIKQHQLSEIELQLSDGLANGMYLLKIDTGGMLINRRLIRQ